MHTPKQIPSYVRCKVTHIGAEWSFEVMAEEPRVAIVDIETDDGALSIGLNRDSAETLHRTLGLFLQDWPKDQLQS